ncbi:MULTISPECIES: hypothetical protein [unclassified Treponema]|uniref:hypothetical protein n=1 Tax=unclassified Treponema TaxID=2638727 RepID=UPI0020A4DCCE|nr:MULTISPECIES: hypothetical protein [unclassified Treponema]UTC66268.1 hypothetical protein E4O06_09785 [Treponema sp. OMZ 789]UTC67746.1 hypothetical protein E4O06_03490 [Treponema sp. OMZ 789]UTC70474.1 hypothetical protein E4O01_03480 [Treponema sp. OMZ 790]UTC71710.1 hypothetical protein E4O02_10030 [Treponema sp. OMZ 791]UTC73184.1 hypothetical protein E4O02_03625 [Treponema sp. OMZ 791]
MEKENCKSLSKTIIKFSVISAIIIVFFCFNLYVVFQIKKEQEEKLKHIITLLEHTEKNIIDQIEHNRDELNTKIDINTESILKEIKEVKKLLTVQDSEIQVKLKNILLRQKRINESDRKNEMRLIYADGVLEKKEAEAYNLLKERKYAAAYKIYNEIKESDPERLSARYYGVYSLFYSNEMNKENYDYILKEISFLREKGMEEDAFKIIENFIKREKAINNEQM